MSEGNGLAARFGRFHERVGKPLFLPDFLDALARVAADPRSGLDERVLALAKLRAWGNYHEYAIHIESDGKTRLLTQRDFGWDLAWLEKGIRWEWLDAPAPCRAAETGRLAVKPIDKTAISKAFKLNERRGTIAPGVGRQIEPVVSPALVDPSPADKVGTSREFREFLEVYKIEHAAEFEELELARSTVKRLGKVVLSNYRQWRASKRNSTPLYKAPESTECRQAGARTSEGALADEEKLSACLPARILAEAPNPDVGGPPRLTDLRTVFPDESLAAESLRAVDRYLIAALGTDYDAEAFVVFVAARRRKGRIHAGLLFNHEEGLPHDFVLKTQQEVAERRPCDQKTRAASAGGTPEPEESKALRELREKEERKKSWPTG